MSSSTGPDLSNATAVYEGLMDDTCRIDRQGEMVYDPQTRRNVRGNLTIYEGRCMVSNDTGEIGEQTGIDINTSTFEVEVPITATGIVSGDIITILTSRRDPELPTKKLRVKGAVFETFAIARTLTCEVDR